MKRFAIIIPSYNNEKFVEKNLLSVFSQRYPLFRIIYIDDNSTDATLQLVSSYIQAQSRQLPITLIHNEVRLGAMHNMYRAIHSCDDDEIVIILDGDDWFASDSVLEILNAAYQNQNTWITYGQHIEYPKNRIGLCKPLTIRELSGNIRALPFYFSHLRSFYAYLFKQIKIDDLMENGDFVSVAADVAMMLPMIEMARHHTFFIPNILYVYNCQNPISDFRVRLSMQNATTQYLRNKEQYAQIAHLPWEALIDETP